jgi:hypothetical protein
MAMAHAPASAQGAIAADQVIAAFLLRFPQFVEWPESVLEGREELVICIAEPDPFGRDLEEMALDEQINGRRLTTRRVDSPGMVEGCHVLYVSSVAERAFALLEAASSRPVLTVGETSDFLDRGGIIHLLIGPNVRFQVNAASAGRAGLRLSSQLLNLAVSVRGTQ